MKMGAQHWTLRFARRICGKVPQSEILVQLQKQVCQTWTFQLALCGRSGDQEIMRVCQPSPITILDLDLFRNMNSSTVRSHSPECLDVSMIDDGTMFVADKRASQELDLVGAGLLHTHDDVCSCTYFASTIHDVRTARVDQAGSATLVVMVDPHVQHTEAWTHHSPFACAQ
jgi:hypothetical protein